MGSNSVSLVEEITRSISHTGINFGRYQEEQPLCMKKSILLYSLVLLVIVSSCRVDDVDPKEQVNTQEPTAETFSAEIPLAWTQLELRLLKGTPGFTPP